MKRLVEEVLLTLSMGILSSDFSLICARGDARGESASLIFLIYENTLKNREEFVRIQIFLLMADKRHRRKANFHILTGPIEVLAYGDVLWDLVIWLLCASKKN